MDIVSGQGGPGRGHSWSDPPRYLAGAGSSVPAEELSSLASSGGMGMAAGVGTGAVEDEDPESWTGALGVSEGGDEAAEGDLACGARRQDIADTGSQSVTCRGLCEW